MIQLLTLYTPTLRHWSPKRHSCHNTDGITTTQSSSKHGSSVCSAMQLVKLVATALFLLVVTVARSEDADTLPEPGDENVRHLHQDDQRVRYNRLSYERNFKTWNRNVTLHRQPAARHMLFRTRRFAVLHPPRSVASSSTDSHFPRTEM